MSSDLIRAPRGLHACFRTEEGRQQSVTLDVIAFEPPEAGGRPLVLSREGRLVRLQDADWPGGVYSGLERDPVALVPAQPGWYVRVDVGEDRGDMLSDELPVVAWEFKAGALGESYLAAFHTISRLFDYQVDPPDGRVLTFDPSYTWTERYTQEEYVHGPFHAVYWPEAREGATT